MSRHFSWQRLYEAVKEGNLADVERASFILGEKVFENGLIHGMNALTLAAKLGHSAIVKFLLDTLIYGSNREKTDPKKVKLVKLDQRKMLFDDLRKPHYVDSECVLQQLGLALEAAAKTGEVNVIKLLLSYKERCVEVTEKSLHQAIASAARQGDYTVVNLLFDKIFSEDLFRIDAAYTVLVESLYYSGNNEIENLSKIISQNGQFYQSFKTFDPLHRSVFLGDRVYLERLIKKECDWPFAMYPKTDTDWTVKHSVFHVAALVCDFDCLDYLYYEALPILGTAELNHSIITKVCVAACQFGRWEAVQHCLRRGWIDTGHQKVVPFTGGHNNKLPPWTWAQMLCNILWSGHLEIANKILDKYFTIMKSKSHNLSKVMADIMEERVVKYPDDAWRNDLTIQRKIHRFVLSSEADEDAKRRMEEDLLRRAVQDGYPDTVRYFLSQLHPVRVDEIMAQYWLTPFFIAHGTGMSVLNFEYFNKYSSDGFDYVMDPNRWGSSSERQHDRFVEVLRMSLVSHPQLASKLDFKTLPFILKDWMENCHGEQYWRNACHIFDFFDAAYMRGTIFTFNELGHAFDLNNVCRLFTIVCGTRMNRIHWPGLFKEALLLSESDRNALKAFVHMSGLCVDDPEFPRNYDLIDEETVGRIGRGNLFQIAEDVVKLRRRPSADRTTLMSFCRIAIRKRIRAVAPRVSSLNERILSLHTWRILPPAIVAYLLFRPELNCLPGRTSMIKTRDAVRFRFAWEGQRYELCDGPVEVPRYRRTLGQVAFFRR